MYQTIVHPTDGSACSTRGLDHAISLAKRYDAELHLLYVVQDAKIPDIDEQTSLIDNLMNAGETVLESAGSRAREADLYHFSTHIRRGIAHRRILELVDDRDADLLVMGTHGRSGIDRFLLGSTTERVFRRASVPILAVGPPERGE